MRSNRFKQVEDLFTRALDVPGESRADFLRRECPDDPVAIHEVMELLSLPPQADQFLDRLVPPTEHHEQAARAASMIGREIGRYRIQRVLAAGGMGVVYEASQNSPKRLVALKLLRQAVASPSSRRRFQAETRTLGRLTHPHIAVIHEAGVHVADDVAVPFFAMELVDDALPITNYATDTHASLDQRIELFTKVCRAVHYGHQRGVIHCDLKPGNILVSAVGEPKIIDFGVARALDTDGTSMASLTSPLGAAGTLAYMSPEQRHGSASDIDVRTDTYALGVVLHELLCGSRPAAFAEPPLRELRGEGLGSAGMRPSRFNPALRGDLDTILLKSIAVSPGDRYQSAAELADDLDRWRRHEPIRARRPTLPYLLVRYAQRNPLASASLGLAATSLIIAALVTALFAWRTEQARAEEATQRSVAERTNQFLETILSSAAALEDRHDLTVREVLDRAADRVKDELADQPAIEASVRLTISRAYAGLAMYEPCVGHLRRAHEIMVELHPPGHADRHEVTCQLAHSLSLLGSFAEAETLLQQVLAEDKALGDESLEACAEQTWSEVAAQRQDAPDAIHHLQQAIAIMRRRPDLQGATLASSLNTLGSLYGQLDDAEAPAQMSAALTEAILIFERELGHDHQRTAWAILGLSYLHRHEGRLEESEACVRESLAIYSRVVGPLHMEPAIALSSLGAVMELRGCPEEAEQLMLLSLHMRRRLVGDRHVQLTNVFDTLAGFYLRQSRFAEAFHYFSQCLHMRQELRGRSHPQVIQTLEFWADELERNGLDSEAEKCREDAMILNAANDNS